MNQAQPDIVSSSHLDLTTLIPPSFSIRYLHSLRPLSPTLLSLVSTNHLLTLDLASRTLLSITTLERVCSRSQYLNLGKHLLLACSQGTSDLCIYSVPLLEPKVSHVATLEEDDEDIIGEFAKQYEAGVRLEDKAENYMRKGS